MKGLIIRDSIVAFEKNIKKNTLIFALIGVVLSLAVGTLVSSIFSVLLPIATAGAVINLFQEDKVSQWNKYLKVAPVKTFEIVIARFLVFLTFILISSVISFTTSYVSYLIHKDATLLGSLILPIAGFISALFLSVLALPAGYKKGDQALTSVILGMSLTVTVGSGLLKYIDQAKLIAFISWFTPTRAKVVIVGTLLLLAIISILLSIRIFDKNEY